MAIDFSKVKTITIPEGSVTKIQINGITVWENVSVLVSITISNQITSIDRGSEFVFGGTVTANYSNGTTADVTSSATLSGYDMSNSGTYTVTVSYTENDITVNATYELTGDIDYTKLLDNESISVIKNLKEFPDIIISAADKNEPSLVSRHLIEIAKSFSRFYNEHQIICEDKQTQNARLALTKAVGIAIKNGLSILGIETPEKM